jgi:hypothetical protein
MKMGNGSIYLATDKADKCWSLTALVCWNIWIEIVPGTYGEDGYTQLKNKIILDKFDCGIFLTPPSPQVLNYWSTLIYFTNLMRIIFLWILTPCSQEDLYHRRSLLTPYSGKMDNMSKDTVTGTERPNERMGTRRMV